MSRGHLESFITIYALWIVLLIASELNLFYDHSFRVPRSISSCIFIYSHLFSIIISDLSKQRTIQLREREKRRGTLAHRTHVHQAYNWLIGSRFLCWKRSRKKSAWLAIPELDIDLVGAAVELFKLWSVKERLSDAVAPRGSRWFDKDEVKRNFTGRVKLLRLAVLEWLFAINCVWPDVDDEWGRWWRPCWMKNVCHNSRLGLDR